MQRRFLGRLAAAFLTLGALAAVAPQAALAADEAPDALIKRLSDETLGAIKADKSIQSGDVNKIMALVDSKIMPNVNFQRMTAAAVGPAWRQATPEQQKRLQEEFKTLLVRTYSGALSQVDDQVISVKPLRAAAADLGAHDQFLVVRRVGVSQALGQDQHQPLREALALLRSASEAIRPSTPLALISCANWLR